MNHQPHISQKEAEKVFIDECSHKSEIVERVSEVMNEMENDEKRKLIEWMCKIVVAFVIVKMNIIRSIQKGFDLC